MNRNNKGQFTRGNQAAKKPTLCPYCKKEVEIDVYVYLKEKKEV